MAVLYKVIHQKEMPEDDTAKTGWKELAALTLLRLIDSGLGPWVLVALFLVACLWLMTRNLDSKDTLVLWSHLTA
jgi:hypothetical protein